MKVTFKTGSEVNYGSTNGEMFFASDTKQLLLNGVKYIPKKLSELTNDSGFLTSITKSMVEEVLTGNITSHTHSYLPTTEASDNQSSDDWIKSYALSKLRGHVYNINGLEWQYLFGVSSANKAYGSILRTSYGNGTPRIQVMGLFAGTWSSWREVSYDGHTHTFASLTSKPTTLSGYGITDAATASHTHSHIVTGGDNRDVATIPNDYFNDFVFRGLKSNSQIGSPTTDSYSYLLGLRGWYNSSGGQSHELAFNNSGVYRRQGATTEWGDWYKLLDSGNYTNYAATKDHTHLYAGSASAGGAATSAVKLNTSRKLWGQSFDGSADIDGNITLSTSEISVSISRGIRYTSTNGFIGFRYPSLADTDKFSGICLGWDNNPTSADASLRINASTFAYKGNTVWHGGNLKLGYTSSGLLRAVQKDSSNNLYVVAPSLFEQGISNNYPKNLRWITEDEGQLAFDKEETAGTTSTVQVSIPVANGTSKGFMKSISTVTDVTGYTPCPVKSGTPYYKEDCLYFGSTEIGYTGIMEYGIQYTYNYGTKHSYLEDYTPDSIPRCVVLCFPDRSSNYRFLFWLSAFDEEDPYIARFYNSAYETWLTIDTASRQIILSYGNTWQS